MLNNKSILITGGTGSLGNQLVKTIYERWPKVKRLVIFSRDEQKQYQMAQKYPKENYPSIRFFIGDVRDKRRLKRAFENIEIVIHAAAMKHIPIAEYNPEETILTNINGAQNVINAALDNTVKKVIALSTDKAAAPINLYGATKLVSDKLFIAANNIKGNRKISFSVVRYGNVMGSNGSVVLFFLKKKKEGVLPITDKRMTRFNISLESGVDMVFYAIENALGGEIIIPKITSYRIMDVANAICPNCEKKEVGIRPGEKLHEEMITKSDAINTLDLGKFYVILPGRSQLLANKYINEFNAVKVPLDFTYSSDNNSEWETVESLSKQIHKLL